MPAAKSGGSSSGGYKRKPAAKKPVTKAKAKVTAKAGRSSGTKGKAAVARKSTGPVKLGMRAKTTTAAPKRETPRATGTGYGAAPAARRDTKEALAIHPGPAARRDTHEEFRPAWATNPKPVPRGVGGSAYIGPKPGGINIGPKPGSMASNQFVQDHGIGSVLRRQKASPSPKR